MKVSKWGALGRLVCSLVLVAWAEASRASTPPATAALTCPDPQATAPLTEAGGASVGNRTGVAWNGKDYAVAWAEGASDYQLHFRRIFADGTPAGPIVSVGGMTADLNVAPGLVWNGSGYGVAWKAYPIGSGANLAHFARLDTSGAVLGAPVRVSFVGTAASANSWDIALASSGSGYAVIWRDSRNGTNDLFATLLDADGTIAGGGTLHDIVLCGAAGSQQNPTITWSQAAGAYAVAWEDFRAPVAIYGRLLFPDGSLSSETLLVPPGRYARTGWLADTGGNLGFAWIDYRTGYYKVYMALLTPGLAMTGPDVRLSDDSSNPWEPFLLWTGGEFGVFWRDSRSGQDLWFQRADASGSAVGGNLRVTSAGLINPCAAFAHYGFLATGTALYGKNYVEAWGCAADSTPPTCPAGLLPCGVTTTTTTFQWSPSTEDATDIAYYVVYRNGSSIALTSDTAFTDSALTPNTVYSYMVQPANAARLQNTTCTTTLVMRTADSLPLTVTKADPDARLKWCNSPAGGCDVYRGTSPTNLQFIGSTGDCTYDDDGVLLDDQLYYYVVYGLVPRATAR